ncbi:MAG TPA: oligopeptide/dipeptide ABC transporter ATP-binding protein [Halococcus sp.]|nr:oligopeptide/dipeptide ABC transporter ATP-binding protein [Halococcus sp.]
MSEHQPQAGRNGVASRSIMEVRGLKKHYPITEGVMKREVGRVKAVDGISFDIRPGETLGLVGESGCGKSTTATSLLRIEEPTAGEILFDGEDITEYDGTALKRFRRRAQMIFQNPDSSFDPRMSVGESVAEPLRIHGIGPREHRRAIAQDLLERVGLDAGDVDRYPHEFSGGQKQRIALARALVVNPNLIVADEPVSALDVSVQAEVLTLIDEIQREFGVSILLISHDMSVVREVCDRVAVMYLGEIVEMADTETLFSDPQHPYTRALLASIPTPDPHQRGARATLTGDVPNPSNPPSGCRFHTRCPEVIQPEGYDFEQENWRAVLNFRVHLRQGIDLDAFGDAAGIERGEDGSSLSDAELKAAVRAEYDIPDTLSDSSAEDVLDEALTSLVDGNGESAHELLATEFETVCERDHPELRETEAGHPAACHLHDEPTNTSDTEPAASIEE